MDCVHPRVGHKPAVYLSSPNILLRFLYYKGANALFRDASCIMSTHFSEYFTVTQTDWTFFFFFNFEVLLLPPPHVFYNKGLYVPKGTKLK